MEFRPHRIKSTPSIRSVLASKTKPEGGYRKPVERLFNISEKFKAGAGMRHGSGLLTTSETRCNSTEGNTYLGHWTRTFLSKVLRCFVSISLWCIG